MGSPGPAEPELKEGLWGAWLRGRSPLNGGERGSVFPCVLSMYVHGKLSPPQAPGASDPEEADLLGETSPLLKCSAPVCWMRGLRTCP